MIKEAYVSFEVAKLLKEKGFNEDCYTYYDDIDDSINMFDKGLHFNNTSYPWGVPYDISKAKKYVVAPTYQMAMDWLREVHNKYCDIGYDIDLKYYCQIIDLKETIQIDDYEEMKIYHLPTLNYNSYYEAVEATLKYCLENLL